MAWEHRNGKRVYYRSRRTGKRVERDYFGGGDMARLAAALDDMKRREDRQDRETIITLRQQWTEVCKPLNHLAVAVGVLMRASLSVAEIKPHCRGEDDAVQTQCDPVLDELLSLVARVDAGDASVLPEIRDVLENQQQIVDHFGNVAHVAADLWLSLYSGGNLLIVEATRERMLQWASTIAGLNPSPLETLMAEQIAVCWLQSHYAEAMHAQAVMAKVSDVVLREMRRRQDESQQRLTTGIHQLAKLRRLLPTTDPDELAGPAVLGAMFSREREAGSPEGRETP